MPREEVSFARGTKSTMPDNKVPGRLLIAIDTGEAYVDDTTESRVQLKDSTKVSKSGDTMTGPLNMSSNKITALATPTADTDAANLGSVKSQVNTAIENAQYAGTSPISVDNIEHTISHDDIGSAGSVGPTANSTASHGGAITVPYITVDAKGHVSAKADRTITLPAGPVNMKGATTSEVGSAGYAPAPAAGEANRYLRSDGTWAVPTGGTYTAGRGLSLSGTEIGHAINITADNRGPTANATVSPGSGFTVPQIYYDAYGHVTSSAANRTLTLNSNILDTADILTSLSGVTSNSKVLGAKLVADAINNLNSRVSTLNTNFFTNTKTVSVKSGISTRIYSHSATPGTYFVTAWVSVGISEDVFLSVSMRKNQTDYAYTARGNMKDGGGVCLTKILQFSDSGTIDVYTYQKRGSNTDINCSIDVIRLC